jgi:hypothetical protein
VKISKWNILNIVVVFSLTVILACSIKRKLPEPIIVKPTTVPTTQIVVSPTSQPSAMAEIIHVLNTTPLSQEVVTVNLPISLRIIGPDTADMSQWDSEKQGYPTKYRTEVDRADVMVGDCDIDGDVDLVDLGTFSANYGKMSGMGWQQGDFNNDGKVDIVDLGLLAGNYGRGIGVSQ